MIELIPAIDIIDGKCVRLSQGDYNTQKVYNENPVEVAKEFEAHGIHRLHIVIIFILIMECLIFAGSKRERHHNGNYEPLFKR